MKSPRARDLATIHATVKQLGMDVDTYRDMLWTVARVRSAKDLDFAGRMQVINHLRAIGGQFKRPERPQNEWSWIDTAPGNNKPRLRYIVVLCKKLGIEAGKQVRYVEGIAENMNAEIRHIKSTGDYTEYRNVRKPLKLCDWGELGMIINALLKAVERKERAAA
jgi:hypothetical protein